jgi:hypothetical protein
MAAVRDINDVVADLLMQFLSSGIYGVRAWFTRNPDVVAIPEPDGGWEVILSRGRILIKIMLDKDYNVTGIRVMYK